MKVLLVLSSLLLFQVTVQAQQVSVFSDTVQWKASSFSDSLNNKTGPSTTEFVTYGSTKVKWIPDLNDLETQIIFDVDRVEGTWSDGTIIYYVSRKGKQRRIRITNHNGILKLFFSYTTSLNQKQLVEYSINNMTKL